MSTNIESIPFIVGTKWHSLKYLWKLRQKNPKKLLVAKFRFRFCFAWCYIKLTTVSGKTAPHVKIDIKIWYWITSDHSAQKSHSIIFGVSLLDSLFDRSHNKSSFILVSDGLRNSFKWLLFCYFSICCWREKSGRIWNSHFQS